MPPKKIKFSSYIMPAVQIFFGLYFLGVFKGQLAENTVMRVGGGLILAMGLLGALIAFNKNRALHDEENKSE